jgi:hypothetical protein
MSDWLRGPAPELLLPSLGETGSFLSTYARPERVRGLIAEHRDRIHDHTRKLYFLASLEAWHSAFCA